MNNSIRKIIRAAEKTLIVGSLAAAFAVPGAHAASGTTSIDIDFPPLLILYYYDSIPITVDAASFATATGMDTPANCNVNVPGVECGVTSSPTLTPTAALGQINANADIATDGAPAALTTTINFDINNAWGVRSLVGAGGAGTLDATITQGGGDFVAASATSDLAGAGAVASSLTLTPGSNVGDLQFAVDLTSLADPSTASDTITVQVVPTP